MKMKFKKVYIEISNICNYSCTFCFKSDRKKNIISPEEFSAILFSIKPYTDYIYLHVLGEPLLHPQLDLLLSMAESEGFHVNITTNGSLLSKQKEMLAHHHVRQYNVSLHDAEENVQPSEWSHYWSDVIDFANSFSANSYFSLRLWNQGSESSMTYNKKCIDYLEKCFDVKLIDDFRNVKLADHIFLQRSGRFSWPGEKELGIENRVCYAMRDHIAILVDGTVVPCCLDADASMALGNVHTQSLEEILNGKRAQNIRNGFLSNRVVEPICRDCGFVLP